MCHECPPVKPVRLTDVPQFQTKFQPVIVIASSTGEKRVRSWREFDTAQEARSFARNNVTKIFSSFQPAPGFDISVEVLALCWDERKDVVTTVV